MCKATNLNLVIWVWLGFPSQLEFPTQVAFFAWLIWIWFLSFLAFSFFSHNQICSFSFFQFGPNFQRARNGWFLHKEQPHLFLFKNGLGFVTSPRIENLVSRFSSNPSFQPKNSKIYPRNSRNSRKLSRNFKNFKHFQEQDWSAMVWHKKKVTTN